MRAVKSKAAATVLSPVRSAIASTVRALEALDRLDRADFPYWAAHSECEGNFARPAQIAVARAIPDVLDEAGLNQVSRTLRDLREAAQSSAADAVRPGMHAEQTARAVAHACAARVFRLLDNVLWEVVAGQDGLVSHGRSGWLDDLAADAVEEADECVKAVAAVVKYIAQTAEDWRRF